jgi:WASH complex subunit 7
VYINKFKVITVFAVLVDEVWELKGIAEKSFYPSMIIFGVSHLDHEALSVSGSGGSAASEGIDGTAGAGGEAGDEEARMGRALPFFQDVSNFVERCCALVLNMIHQVKFYYLINVIFRRWKS